MAAVLNLDPKAGSSAPSLVDAEAAIEVALAYVASLPATKAVPLIGRWRGRFDAVEARALAPAVDISGGTKAAEAVAGKGGKTTKRSRKRAAKRAAAVKKNAEIADKMDTGELTGEHVDVLAEAAKKTDGASLTDEDLIDKVAAVNPDQAKGVIEDYLADKADATSEQKRHDRQRAARRIRRFRTKDDDCEAILIAGDKPTIDRIWNQTTRATNAMYEADGGRDRPAGEHPRTFDQRMFDALTDSIGSPDTAAKEKRANTTAGNDSATTDPCATPAGKPFQSKRYTPRKTTVRPTIVIGVTLAKYLGLAPDQAAEMIGTGPIADSVLAEYSAADPDIVGALYGADGQPLWWGRNLRLASFAQVTALIIRDKRCVLCGADHTRCRAHHLMPWNAPARGETDIDKLALVCDSCHRYIHDNDQTLYRDRRTKRWKLRDALPHEIPPPRPPPRPPRPARGQGPRRT